ncbi:hypothetical protein B5S31_g4235 [[Candida] boidinii]|nr:hypothetical protein B5S29_g4491 [[Candida] boidinii]OWB74442.1 hypothetical protein B5S31_g4235 [[Candida] boidinii]OWB77112.1 hypothetical protein B5S32_g1272 [[Candida] boidinii]
MSSITKSESGFGINSSGDLKTSKAPSTSSITINETDQVRANFTGRSNKSTIINSSMGFEKQPQSSPLLSSTPPTVSKSLIRSYPYLLFANKILGVLTWTNDNTWLSICLVLSCILLVSYFETIIIYLGHVLIAGIISLYVLLNNHLQKEEESNPTLDDMVQSLTTLSVRMDMLLFPITSLNLTAYDLKRLLFTTIFLSPIYIIISYFILPPRTMILWLIIFLTTYHSSWSRVTRKILWKSKTVRLLCFYITGLDFASQYGDKNSLFKLAMNKTNKKLQEVYSKSDGSSGSKSGGAIRFTYVLYENQRRWLGIGWTSNLLSYERAPWTDEFLNESQQPDEFELPQLDDDSGMYWRWVDKTWRLDLTNDASIQLSSSKAKTTANPKPDDGFIYYDNTWKTPSTEDSFSKYTRRRRWIRTAELVSPKADNNQAGTPGVTATTMSQSHSVSANITTTNSSQSNPLIKSASSVSDVQNISVSADTIVVDGENSEDVETAATKILSNANANSATSGVSATNTTSSPTSVSSKKRKSLRFDDNPTILEQVIQHEDNNNNNNDNNNGNQSTTTASVSSISTTSIEETTSTPIKVNSGDHKKDD